MKILHTSDWHLGHLFYGIDTLEDQKFMLDKIQEICRDEKPDLFIHAGDIFDSARPGMGVQKLFADTLLTLRRENPDMDIVVIAGNHDSATMHEIFSRPWADLNVHIFGVAQHDAPLFGSHIVKIDDKCIVVAIPYFSERFMSDDYVSAILQSAVNDNTQNLPVVLMLHTTIDSCDYTGHESDESNYIGGIAGIPLSNLGAGYDYLALGHIHRPQSLSQRAEYSGSPRNLSFDETFTHSVTIVDIKQHDENPVIKRVEVPAKRGYVTIPENGKYATWDEVEEIVDNMSGNADYYRINLARGESHSALSISKVRAAIAAKGGILCCVNRESATTENSKRETFDVQSFKKLSPVDVARRYLESMDSTLSDEQADMLYQIIQQVTDKERNE